MTTLKVLFVKIFRICLFFVFIIIIIIYLFFWITYPRLVIRTETCISGIVNRSTRSLTGVGSKLRRRACEIAKRCAPSRF